MKWISVFFVLSIALSSTAHAFEDEDWRSPLPRKGVFCDVQTTLPMFKGYDGWCRIGRVKSSTECESKANVFAEHMGTEMKWEFVQVFEIYDPLAVHREERFGVNTVSGRTQEELEHHIVSFSNYSDLGDISIDRRLSCLRSDEVTQLVD